MIITKTPFRISFFGGGTDFPQYFSQHGGAVLSTTIDKYCYISCRILPPFFEHKHRIVYSKIENVQNIHEIKHPAVRGILSWKNLTEGLEIHHDGDLPARSGLASSSAFTVGLLNALNALQGKISSKKDLAEHAIHIEQKILEENVGFQDQVAVAYGGLNKISFYQESMFEVQPITISLKNLNALNDHLMLFFTGVSRYSSEIASTQVANIDQKNIELSEMKKMVDIAISLLQTNSDFGTDFGKLLHETWLMKKSLSSKISTPEIDDIYEKALKAGAIGGKILGAGGGGFILFFVKPENQESVKSSLNKLVHVPIKFEHEGSKVVMYQPNKF